MTRCGSRRGLRSRGSAARVAGRILRRDRWFSTTEGWWVMNLRLVQFNFPERSNAEALASEIVPAIRSQPGCERCAFFADYETGDYGLVVLWQSKEAAEAA